MNGLAFLDLILSAKTMEDQAKIREYALKLVTGRMYPCAELSKKLLQRFPKEQKIVSEIIADFSAANLLNDKTYAETYVRFRQGSAPRGKFALRMELKKKGIPDDLIASVLSDISDEAEEAKAENLARKKLLTFRNDFSSEQKKEKLFRFLVGRGFSQSIIFSVLGKIL